MRQNEHEAKGDRLNGAGVVKKLFFSEYHIYRGVGTDRDGQRLTVVANKLQMVESHQNGVVDGGGTNQDCM